jgi:hypothetical protein
LAAISGSGNRRGRGARGHHPHRRHLHRGDHGQPAGGCAGAASASISGASGLENRYIIDGVNAIDTGYGAFGVWRGAVYTYLAPAFGVKVDGPFNKNKLFWFGSVNPSSGTRDQMAAKGFALRGKGAIPWDDKSHTWARFEFQAVNGISQRFSARGCEQSQPLSCPYLRLEYLFSRDMSSAAAAGGLMPLSMTSLFCMVLP